MAVLVLILGEIDPILLTADVGGKDTDQDLVPLTVALHMRRAAGPLLGAADRPIPSDAGHIPMIAGLHMGGVTIVTSEDDQDHIHLTTEGRGSGRVHLVVMAAQVHTKGIGDLPPGVFHHGKVQGTADGALPGAAHQGAAAEASGHVLGLDLHLLDAKMFLSSFE